MSESLADAVRKNNISAYWFLVAASLTGLILIVAAWIFIIIFGSIKAIFSGVVGTNENGFYIHESWKLYLFLLLGIAGWFSQIAAFGLMKIKSRHGRIVGIASFVLTLVLFTPLALLLVYPFAFLVGYDGKYFYQQLNKK